MCQSAYKVIKMQNPVRNGPCTQAARLNACIRLKEEASHAEAASHMPQLEGPQLNIYNYVPGVFGEEK